MKHQPQKPTASELEILHVLWSKGPSTVREVLDSLNEKKDMGYTGVLKLLQIMTAKGTVRRDESQRAHVYEACRPAEQTKRQLAATEGLFVGPSTGAVVAAALREARTAPGPVVAVAMDTGERSFSLESQVPA